MAVTDNDVRHVASLARLGLDESKIPELVRQLNGILEHMNELQGADGRRGQIDGRGETGDGGETQPASPLRSDVAGLSVPLAIPREQFAPEIREGFFLVPRLATHEGDGDRSP